MKKKLHLSLFILVIFNIVGAKNFIISSAKLKNQRSKTSIKEEIGFQIKDALNVCADLNKKIGQVQIELATIQKQLFAKVEKLIDNKRPFKKAKTGELNITLNTIKEVNNRFNVQLNSIKNIKEKLNNNNCLKKTT